MIQKIIPIAASIMLIGSSSLTAYADDMLDKDYIVREIWSDWWHGKGDDRLIFPEASYKHHILTGSMTIMAMIIMIGAKSVS